MPRKGLARKTAHSFYAQRPGGRAREIGGTHLGNLPEFDSSQTLVELVIGKLFLGGLYVGAFFD